MNKLPQFVKDYANYKKNEIREMDSRNIYRPIFLYDIDNIVNNIKRGSITINEGMRRLSEI